METNIVDIQKMVNELGDRIGVPRELLIVQSQSRDDGVPYVEVCGDGFSYISSERGYNIFRKEQLTPDDLLYLIFDRITAILASDYELKNRVDGVDFRRIYFKKKVELMGCINLKWVELAEKNIENILSSSPYRDK